MIFIEYPRVFRGTIFAKSPFSCIFCYNGCMEWIMSHQSALEFWQRTVYNDIPRMKKLRAMKAKAKMTEADLIKADIFRDFTMPLHVLVADGNARKVRHNIYCHTCSKEFPGGSFVQTDTGLIVSSPELCFLQMADELSFVDLVKLGFEICGSFRPDKKKGFRNEQPLTSAAKLKAYIDKAVGFYN